MHYPVQGEREQGVCLECVVLEVVVVRGSVFTGLEYSSSLLNLEAVIMRSVGG